MVLRSVLSGDIFEYIWYLIDVTSHPLWTAAWQILDPRKPLPPATMSFFAADDMVMFACLLEGKPKGRIQLKQQLKWNKVDDQTRMTCLGILLSCYELVLSSPSVTSK